MSMVCTPSLANVLVAKILKADEVTVEDEGRGRETQTPIMTTGGAENTCDWQGRAHEAEYRLRREQNRNTKAKRTIRYYEARIRQAESGGRSRYVSEWNEDQTDRTIQDLMNENRALYQDVQRLKCIISTLEIVIQILHEGACKHVGASQIRNDSGPGLVG
jgi:hypothetical protein